MDIKNRKYFLLIVVIAFVATIILIVLLSNFEWLGNAPIGKDEWLDVFIIAFPICILYLLLRFLLKNRN